MIAHPRFEVSLFRQVPGEVALELSPVAVPMPLEIVRGQTLAGVLGELGLEPTEVYAAVEAASDLVDVHRIQAGEPCLAYFDEDAQLASFRVQQRGKGWLELARQRQGWDSSWHAFKRETAIRLAKGELEGALESALRKAGAPGGLAFAMSEVLQWDLDFNRDLRIGDQFQVLFEEIYLDGELAGLGQIQALIYENRGRRNEVYQFQDGYYDAEGRPVQKLFLRSPLPFTRVTSKFSHRRFHPVLKTYRPHYGVDYGAPVGTSVRVTANGTVVSAAYSRSAGKMVKVRHPNGYTSAYLHLSRYAEGIGSGKRVRQGEVIGFVGSTGLVNGAHLDYRVQHNGRWINPLSIQSVPSEPIPGDQKEAFEQRRSHLQRLLRQDPGSVLGKVPDPVVASYVAGAGLAASRGN